MTALILILIVYALAATIAFPLLVLEVACFVLGCYALFRVLVEVLRRVADSVEENTRP